jgi:hypothetical protein
MSAWSWTTAFAKIMQVNGNTKGFEINYFIILVFPVLLSYGAALLFQESWRILQDFENLSNVF